MDRRQIVVLGAGPAGLTAGLFAARQGRSTLVVDPLGVGGAILNTDKIEDFPGFPDGVAGFDLGPGIQEQVIGAGGDFEVGEVAGIERRGDDWVVRTDSAEIAAGAVIVATGSRARKLGIAQEDEFEGRGVSHCASCDGVFFRDKLVAVAGGGDSALLETIELTRLGVKVVLLHADEAPTAQETYVQRVRASAGVEIRPRTVVEEIQGNGRVDRIGIRDLGSDERSMIDVSGVFVQVGRTPNTEFLQDVVELDQAGRVPTDIKMASALPGLYAAGDVRSDSAAQAITAAGDGATAAIAASRYLDESGE